ncbi:MAG: hypothetical protein J3K34DRAFT_31376 [Monoraphidium minutum]|nr:MAG: hypothetical protein J3K34DRAFT_31376 [Monoraphidium minutum]
MHAAAAALHVAAARVLQLDFVFGAPSDETGDLWHMIRLPWVPGGCRAIPALTLPHTSLADASRLGLGAKYLSHSKALETASLLDHRLKRRIERSAPERPPKQHRSVAEMLRARPGQGQGQRQGQAAEASSSGDESSDDEGGGGGKLSALARGSKAAVEQQQQRQQQGGRPHHKQQQHDPRQKQGATGGGGGGGPALKRVLTAEERRRELLAAPQAELSKWSRKRMRQKEKRAAAEAGAGAG